jgi:phospholipid transport system substrate-binding protein|uniref:ABC transporter substrate-binding protein n=1 Tax=Desulfobacca acetoxidans TaxID=60893 RepID=A0A7V6DQY9_9BACT
MRGVNLKMVSLTFTLILTIMSGPAFAAAPTEAVRGTIDQVIRLLSNPALKDPSQKNRILQQVRQVVDRRFDYEEMARRTLTNWNQLSPSQRREFVTLFSELLATSYAGKLAKYSGERVSYVGDRVDGDLAEVNTMLVRSNDRIPINYRLINKSQWMVYDVVIEGVSLVNNYRSQFSRVISESSYADLVKRLQAKVDEQRKAESL